MEWTVTQQRRGLQQEEPLKLMPRLEPVIHSPARLLQHQPVLRLDKARLHLRDQLRQLSLGVQVFTHRQGGQEGFGEVHQRVLQRPAAQR